MYSSGSGFVIQPASKLEAALTRYGGIVESSEALRSTHVHAVSVRRPTCPPQLGGHQSAGHPLHTLGVIVGGDVNPGSPVNVTP
jgi:hypothetical protein